MATLTPVEGNPFEQKQHRLTPVQGNPFAPTEASAPMSAEAAGAQVDAINDAQAAPAPKGAEYGAAAAPLEFMAAFNRGATKLADFLTTDQINAVAQVLGSEFRVPSITSMAEQGTAGGFMEPGAARDVVRAAGEVIPAAVTGGAALTQAAARLPASAAPAASRLAAQQAGGRAAVAPVVAPGESAVAGAVRQIGAPAVGADIGYGAASGVGAEVGRQEGGQAGELAGAILAPLSVAGGKAGVTELLKRGRAGIESLTQSVQGMSDEGAATLLADAMVREGLTPNAAAKALADLGPEAVPADIGEGFARLLRTASNKIPRIEGEAGEMLGKRQAAQGDRIASAFDDAAGIPRLSLDDEMIRLERAFKPEIDRLYTAARQKSEQVLGGPKATDGYGSLGGQKSMTKLERLLAGENVGGSATDQARRELTAKQLSGEPVTQLDKIDATKRAMDDQINAAIREGKTNKSRSLLMLKNALVKEADSAIPEYKEARNLFAGKATLENAADLGQQFFKMKPRDVAEAVKTMGDSEKRMFRLGAKQALADELDRMQMSRDKLKALFGRGGDAEKLRFAFESPRQFKQFADAMEREAQFIRTRRAAQANSTTAKQLFDEKASFDAMSSARALAGDPTAYAGTVERIIGGLSQKKQTEAYTKALEQAGDILLSRGMSPDRVESILKRGVAKEVGAALGRALPKEGGGARRQALIGGVTQLIEAD